MASLFSKVMRYSVAAGCTSLILFWDAKDPLVLDMKQMQVTEGTYKCIWHSGGKYGPTGPDVVDGVIYYTDFSYLFGLNAPTPCFKELTGHRVRMTYLISNEFERRLTLEVLDLQSGRIFGVTKEKNFALYQEQVESKLAFYLSKLGLLLLALRVTCWSRLKVLIQQLLSRANNHGFTKNK
jgi:hypothetical protein